MKKFRRRFYAFIDLAECFVLAVFLVLLCFTFLFRTVSVRGRSMENTLFNNDRLVISHFLYTPKQGDIIVANSDVLQETIIKRIIAVENQKVVINTKDNTVSVDGKILSESYIKEAELNDSIRFSDVFYNKEKEVYEYSVPFGYVFVMGDNRNSSTDSRAIGFVSKEEIAGRVLFRFHSEKAKLGKVN